MTSKSVSTTLDQEDYDALKALADEQDRNISGQVRHMLRNTLALHQAERDMEGMQPSANFVQSLTPHQIALVKAYLDNPPTAPGISLEDLEGRVQASTSDNVTLNPDE